VLFFSVFAMEKLSTVDGFAVFSVFTKESEFNMP